jgi:hypothetical protein
VTADITGAQAILDDATAKPEQKARAQRLLQMGQARGKSVVDRYHTGKYFDDAQRDAHYTELGLKPAGGTSSASSTKGKALTKEDAAKLLQEAGGDKDKARALARQRGYTF